jgi:hypothetical protein
MSSFPGSPRILKGGIVPLDMGITLSGSGRPGFESQAAHHRASGSSVDQQMVAKLASAHERLMAKLDS